MKRYDKRYDRRFIESNFTKKDEKEDKKNMNKLKELKIGDSVFCTGDSGFCSYSYEKIKKIEYQYDEKTGKKYKVICLSNNHKFDSRNGLAITEPTGYYIKVEGE
jgi:F0F1-type ATP synthase gamma subunit